MDSKIIRFFELFSQASYDERLNEMPAVTMTGLFAQIPDVDVTVFTSNGIVELGRALTGDDASATGASLRQQMEAFMAKRE